MNTGDAFNEGTAGGREASARGGPLIPAHLDFLMKERPLLWYESPEEYDTILAEIVAELNPRGMWEWILAKDLVDYVWEVRQLRRLRVAALHAELPGAAADAMDDFAETCRNMGRVRSARELAEWAAAGEKAKGDEDLTSRARKKHITPDVLHLLTYKQSLPALTAISRDLDRMERRRDQILKQFEDRRAAFAAMARSLVAREDAEMIDLPAGA